MTTDALTPLSRAADAADQLIDGVAAEQWSEPTPCADWTARALVEHLVAGNRLFARVLRGEPTPSVAQLRSGQGLALLGDVSVEAHRDSSQQLLAAFGQPGVLERRVRVPFGEVPGIVALQLRVVEFLVHGWDLARATGQPTAFPDELVEPQIDFSRSALGQLPPERTPFGSPRPAAEDAPAIDRLAALLGRQVEPLS